MTSSLIAPGLPRIADVSKTFINPMLASIYKVPAPARDDWRSAPPRVAQPGLLGHVSFLRPMHIRDVIGNAARTRRSHHSALSVHPGGPVDVDTSIPEPSAEAKHFGSESPAILKRRHARAAIN